MTITAADRASVMEETRLIIVEALRHGDTIQAESLAKIVWSSYPQSGLTEQQIADSIKEAAVAARVEVVPRAGVRPRPPR